MSLGSFGYSSGRTLGEFLRKSPQACPVYRCIFLDAHGKMSNAHVEGKNRDTMVVMTPPRAAQRGTTTHQCKRR